VKRLEARIRMALGELVLIGDPDRAELDFYEEREGERRCLGTLALARPEELGLLFERLAQTDGGEAPPSTPGPLQPFQPPK
jgi:hypothetical protein